MSADRLLSIVVACGLCTCGGMASADDEEMPEIDFLEYLGSWEESDEDWLVVNDAEVVDDGEETAVRSDPAPKGEESTEKDDER